MDTDILRYILDSLRNISDYIFDVIKKEENLRKNFKLISPDIWTKNKSNVLTIEKEIDKMLIDIKGLCICKTKRKDGRYQGYYNKDGERFYFYGRTLEDVKNKATKLVNGGYKKEKEKKKKKEHNFSLFANYVTKWLEIYKKPNVKPKTYEFLELGVKHLVEEFGNRKLLDITTDDLQVFLTNYPKERQRTNMQQILKQVFTKAFFQGLIKINPCDGLEIKKSAKNKRHALTRQEQNILCEKVKGRAIEPLFFLLLTTGLRVGEALALTDKDIDFEKNTVSVTKNIVYVKGKAILQDTPKTSAGVRTVPFPDFVQKYLQGRKGLLFPVSYNAVRLGFKRLGQATKINVTAHILRHTYATRLEEAGFSVKVKMYLLGHSSMEMTQNTYTDIQADYIDTLLDKIKSVFH